MTHKICMIVHQFPPDAGATAIKMAYRAKFLVENGYEVDIFAPGHARSVQGDDFNFNMHWIPVWASTTTPDLDYTRLKARQRTLFPGPLQPLTGYLRWLPTLVWRLRKFDGKDSILYTYNNPVTLHLAALAVRKRFKAWVCEFRDPISDYEYSARGWLGSMSDGWLERKILKHADMICMRRGIQKGPKDFPEAKGIVTLLPDYGVDLDLFEGFASPNEDFGQTTGVFAGTVFGDMSFAPLSSGLDLYRKAGGELEVRIFGPEHKEHLPYKNLTYCGNIEFEALIEEYRKSLFLIVYDLSNSRDGMSAEFFPSKLAELIAAQRPLLFIGNTDSKTAKVISKMKIGVCTTNEPKAIADAIAEIKSGLSSHRFNLTMTEEKAQLVDARIAEHAFVNMLSCVWS